MKEDEERKAELDEDDMMFTYTKTEVLNKKSKNKKKLLLNRSKKNKKLLSKKSKSIVKKALTNAVSNNNSSINTRRKAMLNSLNTINNKHSEKSEITTTKSASLIDSELNKFKKLEKQKQQQKQPQPQKQQQQQQQQQNKKNKENESKSNSALNKTVEGKSTTRRSGKKGASSTHTELKNDSSTSFTTLETPSSTTTTTTTTNKLGNKKSKSVSSLLMLSASSSSSNFDNDLHLDKNNAINHLNEMLKMTKYTGAFSNESTNLKLFNNTLTESDNENEYSYGELSKQPTTATTSLQPTTSAGALRFENSPKQNEAKKIKKLIGAALDSDDFSNKSLKRGRKPKKIPTQPIKYLTGSVESSSTGDNYLSKLNDQIKSQMLMNKKETVTNILEHSQSSTSSSSNPFISSQSQSPVRTLATSPAITSVAKSSIITKMSPLSVIRTIVRPYQGGVGGMPANSLTIPAISNPKTTVLAQQQSMQAVKSQSHSSLQTISNRPSAYPAIQVLNQNPKPILVTKRVNQQGAAANPINLPLTTPLGKPLTFLSNAAAAPSPGSKVVIRAFNTQPSTINIMNKPALSNQVWVLNQPGGQPTGAMSAKPAATAVSTNSAASVAATVAAAVAAETSQNLISSFLKQQQQQQQPVIKTIVNNNIFTSNTNNYVINNSNNYTIIANPNSSSSKANASSNASVDTQLVLNKLNEKFQN